MGPGLLESAYQACLCHELALRRLAFEQQKPLPIEYKGLKLDAAYRLDLVVEGLIVVELKAIEALLPIHQAQLLTYLRLADPPSWAPHQLQHSNVDARSEADYQPTSR